MGEIPKDTVGKELVEDGKYSVHNWYVPEKLFPRSKINDNYALYLWND